MREIGTLGQHLFTVMLIVPFENTLNLMKKLNVLRTKFLREECLHLFTVMLIVSFENVFNLMKKLHLSPRKFPRKRCLLKT